MAQVAPERMLDISQGEGSIKTELRFRAQDDSLQLLQRQSILYEDLYKKAVIAELFQH
jgi:hypothetical protein